MQRVDRGVGIALALLALLVLWTARAFPDVPGQKVGAGFLPLMVGAALLVCALLLVLRSLQTRRYAQADSPAPVKEQWAHGLLVLGAIVAYGLLADKLGFLILAPLLLLVTLRAFGLRWSAALLWAVVGTAVVHVAFYKLLRVPLPWGLLRPFY